MPSLNREERVFAFMSYFFFLVVLFLSPGLPETHCVAWAGVEFMAVLLPQSPGAGISGMPCFVKRGGRGERGGEGKRGEESG